MKKTLCFILVIILLSLYLPILSAKAAKKPNDSARAEERPNVSKKVEKPSISARGAILMEAGNGEALYELNPDAKLPMASTTKIMTALLVLEKAEEENAVVHVTDKMVAVEGTSMGLLPGDQPTLVDLATGMLLASGNDAANTGAIAVAGSMEAFAELMNRKAQELGMKNSHFVTPSGLDAEGHYSTARDMAILAQAALQNEKFAEICATRNKKIEMQNNRVLSVFNHNKLLRMYEGCTGIKTGFTKKSGRCLVSSARRGGVTLIAVTLGASDDWNAHMSMFNYGFSQIINHNGTAEMSESYSVPLVGGVTDQVIVAPTRFDGALLKKGAQADFTYEVRLPKFVYAPVEKNQVVGEVICFLNGKEVDRLDLLTSVSYEYREPEVTEEKKPGFFERLFGWFKKPEQSQSPG